MSFTTDSAAPVDVELEPFDLATGETLPAEGSEDVEVPDGDEDTPEPQAEAEDTPDEFEDVDTETLGQTFKVKVDGEEVEVSLDEALAGYMRQADYTRKTQEAASHRKQAEAMVRLEEALTADFEGTVERLAAALGIQRQVAQTRTANEDDDFLGLEPEGDSQLARQVQALQAQMAAQEQAARQAFVDNQLAQLTEQYKESGLTAESILSKAVEERIPDLGTAARLLNYEYQEAKKAEATKERIVQRKRTASKVQQSGGVASRSATTGPKDKPSIEEAFLAALDG